ncbi:MAG TPA: ABC transporter permease [Terracidiphilus sp.]
MRWFDRIAMKFTMLVRRRNAGAKLEDELLFHLERQVAENVAKGMPPRAAREAALRTFGNPALLRDQARSTWSWAGLESLLRDARYSLRTLVRTPGFAAITVLVMALGIGANVTIFTVVRSVLLKPLPFRDPDKLVMLYETETNPKGPNLFMPVAAGSFYEWQQATRGKAEMALVSPFQDYNVSAEGGKLPEKVEAAWCSGNFFSVLGVRPMLGRSLTPADDRPGAPAVVLLAHAFWMRRYSGDSAILGKTTWLDAKPYTVIGVLPESFLFSSSFGGDKVQLWTPVAHEAPHQVLTTFEDHEFLVSARLLPGTTLSGLVTQLKTIQKRIEITHARPAIHDSAIGRSLLDDGVDSYKTPLYAMFGATACVLLIACMNVASLLVARTAARRKELAIRSALGGGRMRLLRERIIESVLLSGAGGGLGLLLAFGAVQWVVRSRPDMNRISTVHMDGLVVAFALGAIVVCSLLSGLISAFGSAPSRILATLQESSRQHGGGRGRSTLRRGLLVVEVSLTVVLLVGAGLLLKSYQHLRNNGIGVPVDNVLTLSLSLPEARYRQPIQQVGFLETLIERVRAIPGIQAAGLVSRAPGEGYGGDRIFNVVEHPPVPRNQVPDLMVRGADPGYFAAIRLPLMRGRIFTADERLERAHVAVITESAARLLFPNEDPIGKHLRPGDESDATAYEIVGVVGDTRWNITQPTVPTLYWPIFGNDYTVATIVVRSERDVASFALPVQKLIGALDQDLPVSDVMTLREAVGKSTIDSQFDSILVLAFAVIALLLAAAGLYGVLAYLVTQRTGEIGIRIALGARRESVLGLMLIDGLKPALVGLVLGLSASAGVVRLIRSMLYETRPLDPAVFAAVSAALMLVAAAACMLPAWRASRLDPMQALRTE